MAMFTGHSEFWMRGLCEFVNVLLLVYRTGVGFGGGHKGGMTEYLYIHKSQNRQGINTFYY